MRHGRWGMAVVVLAAVGLVGSLPGCIRPKDDGRGTAGEAPSYAALRDEVNDRSERLARLWARATVVVDSIVEGEERRDQGDGYLQIVQPARLSLSLGKSIDRMYFFLGSNFERFWWVETLDADNRVALVGTHEGATPARAREFGVPVHPLDLIELLGITRLPEEGPEPEWDGGYRGWAVTAPARFGTRRVIFDPIERYPVAIELLDRSGRIAASAKLENYTRLAEFEGVGLRPEMPSEITIDLPSAEATVLLDLGATKSIERVPRDVAFDLEALLRRERVEDVRDLDEPGS